MSGTTPGTGGSHYNPDEPRDWHGRWTTGGSSWRDTPLRDPGAAGRARTLLGHARVGAWQKGVLSDVAWPTPAEAARFSRLLTAWNAASGLDDAPFAAWFTRGLDIGPATRDRLRQAAAGAAQARTIAQMIEASIPLTAAIKDIGGDRWPGMLKRLEDLAETVKPEQLPARVRTTSGKAPTEQTGLAAGDPPAHDAYQSLRDYFSEGLDSLSRIPDDLTELGRLLINDPMAFLAAIAPSLAGLGVSLPPKVGNVYFQEQKAARVTQDGLDIIERHLARLDKADGARNDEMIARLTEQLGQKITGADLNFYVHEILEDMIMDAGWGYDDAHEWALAVARVSRFSLYHPDVIRKLPNEFNSAWRAYWGIQ